MNWSKLGLQKLPEQISELKNIEELDISKNSLTTLPSKVKKLKTLKKLNLKDNKFTDAEKEKIKKWLPNCEIEF